jgi:hypothetical protein
VHQEWFGLDVGRFFRRKPGVAAASLQGYAAIGGLPRQTNGGAGRSSTCARVDGEGRLRRQPDLPSGAMYPRVGRTTLRQRPTTVQAPDQDPAPALYSVGAGAAFRSLNRSPAQAPESQ